MARRIVDLFDHLSLVARLMLAVTLAFAVAAFAVLYLTTRYAAIDATTALQSEYANEVGHLSSAITPALLAHDSESLKNTLESLRRSPSVIRVGFRDVSDTAGFSRDTPATLTAPRWFVSLFDTNSLGGTQPLTVGGVYYGLLTLDLSPVPSINLAWERTQRQLAILALALGLVYVGIWLVLHHGLKPLQELLKGTRVLRDGDFSVRLQTRGSPELRSNIAEFNRMAVMLEQAQKRNTETLTSNNRQLQQQGAFATALLEAQVSAGVCLAVTDGEKILSANQALLDFVHTSLENLLQTAIVDMLDPICRGEFERQYLRVLEGETLLTPRIEIKLAGLDRWAEVAIFGISGDNKRLVAILGLDITQRKRDSQQLWKAHEILRTKKEQAERANKAKTRFLAAASHDLRQPLHALKLFSAHLANVVTTPQQQQLTKQINDAVANIADLLESLLNISKIDLATTRPSIRAIDLSSLFEQIVATHQHEADTKGLDLRVANTSLWILSDPAFFFRILSNLVSNALRYTERGGVLIGARRTGNDVRVEVWDTGVGIEEKYFPLLFQEFYQVGNLERNVKKGLGLGLAIVERLTTVLGYKIGIRSKPGRGSVFKVLVPRAQLHDIVEQTRLTDETTVRILLVTADELPPTELADMLMRWGYVVSICGTNEIDETLNSTPFDFDLMIKERRCTDCAEQGFDAIARGRLPVICLTSEAELATPAAAQRACTAVTASASPAKLRALILHLLTQEKAKEVTALTTGAFDTGDSGAVE